jgi:hypothetical protein
MAHNTTRNTTTRCRLVIWDWEDQPDWDSINDALAEFESPMIHAIASDNDDNNRVLISERNAFRNRAEIERAARDEEEENS